MLRCIFLLCCLCLVSCSGGGGTAVVPVVPLRIPTILSVNLPSRVLLGAALTLDATVDGTVDEWHWSFTGGTNLVESEDFNPTVRFEVEGLYAMQLEVANELGSSEPFAMPFTVIADGHEPEPPTILAVAPTGNVGIAGHPVSFHATATNDPTDFEWDFQGIGTPSLTTEAEPTIIFTQSGELQGQVRAHNAFGVSEWTPIQLTVLPQTTVEVPRIVQLDAGGDMGASGAIVAFDVVTKGFPIGFEWHFGQGAAPNESFEKRPQVILGAPGIYRGQVRVSSLTHISEWSEFTYSVGGAERDRMRTHWGGLWSADTGLAPLPGGNVASLIFVPQSNPQRSTWQDTDLDPTFNTTWALPYLAQQGNSIEEPLGILAVYGPAGEIVRALPWEAQSGIILHKLFPGPNGTLMFMIGFGSTDYYEEYTYDIQPGPGEWLIAGSPDYKVCVAQATAEGQILWARTFERSRIFDFKNQVVATPDGDVLYLDIKDGLPGHWYSNHLYRLDAAGNTRWASYVGGVPEVIAPAPDGGAVAMGTFAVIAEFGPPAEGGGAREPQGARDGFLVRYGADGSYQWDRTWGGTPTTPGRLGARVDSVSVAVKVDGTILAGGLWHKDRLVFEPGGPIGWLPEGCPYTGGAFVQQIRADGTLKSVQTWSAPSDEYFIPPFSMIDLQEQGYAVAFHLFGCTDIPAVRDLDPGPGEVLAQPATWMVTLRIDTAGDLAQFAEYNTDAYNPGPRFCQDPVLTRAPGGMYLQWAYAPNDLDPGPGKWNATRFQQIETIYTWFLTDNLQWGAPSP